MPRLTRGLALTAGLAIAIAPSDGWSEIVSTTRAQVAQSAEVAPLEVRLLVGDGSEPVLTRGERVRVELRTDRDAFVALFHIDTDGRVDLVYPPRPSTPGVVPGERSVSIPFRRSPYWTVGDDPGVGYLFAVASTRRLDFDVFAFDPELGWDLSRVGESVYSDPYLAIDAYVEAILPEWESVPFALDFVTYHVETPRAYPRFLCYDCHEARPEEEWDPYRHACTAYRVVVYDDAYFYPVYRYVGHRTVFPRPLPDRPRYEVVKRDRGEAWSPIVRTRAVPERPALRFKEAPTGGTDGGERETSPPGVEPRVDPSSATAGAPPAGVRRSPVSPAPARAYQAGPRSGSATRPGRSSSRLLRGGSSGSPGVRAERGAEHAGPEPSGNRRPARRSIAGPSGALPATGPQDGTDGRQESRRRAHRPERGGGSASAARGTRARPTVRPRRNPRVRPATGAGASSSGAGRARGSRAARGGDQGPARAGRRARPLSATGSGARRPGSAGGAARGRPRPSSRAVGVGGGPPG